MLLKLYVLKEKAIKAQKYKLNKNNSTKKSTNYLNNKHCIIYKSM